MTNSWLASLLSARAEDELQAALRKVVRHGFGKVVIEIAGGRPRLIATETTQLVRDPLYAETEQKPAGD
jgi:hypothetical protein